MLFKLKNNFEHRVSESKRIREKYPDRIPVIVEKIKNSDVADIDRNKFLVPSDLTYGQFFYVIRKRISMPPEKAIFCFVNNSLPPISNTMGSIYKEHADPDGFLYVQYSGESTFGKY